MKALLIPIKNPANAKTRLAGLLSAADRRRLACVMFEDVAAAVAATTTADAVFAVTSFQPAIERARSLGWNVLQETSQSSESESVDWASGELKARGFDWVMRLPADLPLVKPEDIDGLLSVDLEAPAALIVPSRDGTGTNALIRRPPDLFPSRFGPNSFFRHSAEATRARARMVVVTNERIALDIDDPSDLALFYHRGGDTRTHRFLVESGLGVTLPRTAFETGKP